MMPQKEDCFGDTFLGGTSKCCYIEGEKNLSRKTSCVLIEDNPEKKMELINELSQIATKLKVECYAPKKYISDCSLSNEPLNEKDCLIYSLEDDNCCFVKISSPQFSGNICKKLIMQLF